MTKRFLIAAVATIVACGQKTNDPAPGPTAAPATTSADAAKVPPAAPAATDAPTPATPAPATKPSPPESTPAQRKAYRTHLAAGRRLAKAAKWGEAAREFDAALAALPGDARATGELGWALFNAGDHVRAKTASESAAKQAIDGPVKAASLYNLGRVEEATGDLVNAARHYAASLALRPSKTVSERLAKLGTAVTTKAAAPEPPPCGAPQPLAAVCACLEQATAAEEHRPDACELGASDLVPGVRVVHAGTYVATMTTFVLAGSGDAWSVVAQLEHVYNPGAFGIYEELGEITASERTVGGRQVVAVTWSKSRVDNDPGVNETESEDTTHTLFCVRPQGAGQLACPVLVPTMRHFERGPLFDDPREMGLDHIDPALQSKPVATTVKLKTTLGDDGVVTVTLDQGAAGYAEKPSLGRHPLW